MPAILLEAGTNETEWFTPSVKSVLSIGNAADTGWTAGSVGVYAKRVDSSDDTEFLIESFDAPTVKVFDVGMADQLQVRLKGDGTDGNVHITYS